MYNPIFNYELRYWLKSPLSYFLLVSFLCFSWFIMLGTGGFFDGPIETKESVNFLNSPYALCLNGFLFAKFLLFVLVIFFGLGSFRDYRHNSHLILFSFPIKKFQYLNGKFWSAALFVALCSFFVFAGIYFGEIMLGKNNPQITNFQFKAYLVAYFFYLLWTLIIIGVFVFTSVTLTRNLFAGFVVIFCFVLLQIILENALFNYPRTLALLDPFAQNAFYLATEDWTQTMRNSSSLPLSKMLVANRLFWMSLALIMFYFLHKKFDFLFKKPIEFGQQAKPKELLESSTKPRSTEFTVHIRHDILAKIRYTLLLSISDLRQIFNSWMFILSSSFGIITIFFIQLKVVNTGDFNLLPLTRLFIGAPLKIYSVIIIFCTFLFSNLIVERSRINKMHLLMDATPIQNWQLIGSKVLAVSAMQVFQLILFLLVSIIIQLANKYYHFEFDLYFIQLFILSLPSLFVWTITSLLFHSLISNRMIGLFLLSCLWLGSQSLDQLGINTHLLAYNLMPNLEYSDFNGFGNQLKGYFLVSNYWLSFAFVIIPCLAFFWRRGSASSFKERLHLIKQRLNPVNALLLLLFVLNFTYFALSLYKEEKNEKQNNYSSKQLKKALNEHKAVWNKYANITQPIITEIDLKLDLFPRTQNFYAEGVTKLINNSHDKIDTLLIRTGFDEISNIYLEDKAELILEDKIMKSQLFILKEQLNPGDSLTFKFDIRNGKNTTFTRNSNVLTNGTFLKHDILPRIGYQFKEDLDNSRQFHYFHDDAHTIHLHTKISTSEDQIAISPGVLVDSFKDGNRNYFSYATSFPIKINFSFHSGKYLTAREYSDSTKIELMHHENHSYNFDEMFEGIKASLDYNRQFGNYPHEHVRIIEYPHILERYAATLSCNNIPSSELLFNLNTNAMKNKSNLAFYVMAHELTHEWFGNQLKPAKGPGAKMISESITEYLTFCIYKKYKGQEMANKFLEQQFERYQRGRKREKGKEPPLFKVRSNQDYIAYGKGTIAFHQISKIIGEEEFLKILQHFHKEYSGSNYPNSEQFVEFLKNKISDIHHPLVNQWFLEVHDFKFEEIY